MNRESVYQRTCNVLYNAYFKDELRHGSCAACAVGNLLKEPAEKYGISNSIWAALFVTVSGSPYDRKQQLKINTDSITDAYKLGFYHSNYKFSFSEIEQIRTKAFALIADIGYTAEEMAKIEFAFESANQGRTKEDFMFNGLEAVLDILKEIHEVENNEEEVKKFSTHYQTKKHELQRSL